MSEPQKELLLENEVPPPLMQKVEPKSPSMLAELRTAFVHALGTTGAIAGGAAVGATNVIIFALASNGLGQVVSNVPGVYMAYGLLLNAPFVHHLLKGKTGEGLNMNGAFVRTTKAVSYVAGALGGLALANVVVNGVPDDFRSKQEPAEQTNPYRLQPNTESVPFEFAPPAESEQEYRVDPKEIAVVRARLVLSHG